MTHFTCAGCGHPLTGELKEARPSRDSGRRARHRVAPARMARGTYEVGHAVGQDAGLLILHPGDAPGAAPHPDPGRRNGCCGLDGQDGPNLVCAGCGAEVATEESDCWTRNLVALTAAAVAVVSGSDRPGIS
ncbi:hypothetical protein OG455_33065 [Kitasatospora sp. NBC_01287]|uniref:hypothetical protein n=1 Tax=Kitasatospora sp. NBC_01287 TaxID=2903573 RepID=UPI0022594CA6|nr:hypothetical protein [Kitasatospora sp. NBC_01287]MCX4750289.1 hypothetical protein [Kitasatospora sp. NBC_01287]